MWHIVDFAHCLSGVGPDPGPMTSSLHAVLMGIWKPRGTLVLLHVNPPMLASLKGFSRGVQKSDPELREKVGAGVGAPVFQTHPEQRVSWVYGFLVTGDWSEGSQAFVKPFGKGASRRTQLPGLLGAVTGADSVRVHFYRHTGKLTAKLGPSPAYSLHSAARLQGKVQTS